MSGLISAVVTGVLVFVGGQAFLKFVLEPIQKQRKTIGEIAFASLMYANVETHGRTNDVELLELTTPVEASEELRRLAGELRSSLWTIPFYRFWTALRLVPKEEDALKASSSLVGWSNSIHGGDPHPHKQKLKEALDLSR